MRAVAALMPLSAPGKFLETRASLYNFFTLTSS